MKVYLILGKDEANKYIRGSSSFTEHDMEEDPMCLINRIECLTREYRGRVKFFCVRIDVPDNDIDNGLKNA